MGGNSFVTGRSVNPEIERCYREIDKYRERAERDEQAAWLVTLGIEDWLMEIRLIEEELKSAR